MYIDRDFAQLTTATWRAVRQHWQIQSARLFCVRAEPLEQAATWHSESVW